MKVGDVGGVVAGLADDDAVEVLVLVRRFVVTLGGLNFEVEILNS